jgi:hypothetical protein
MTVPTEPHSSSNLIFAQSNDTHFPYHNCIGKFQFTNQGTRVDITYYTSHWTKFCETPKAFHVVAIKCIMKYLKGLSNLHITYNARPYSNNQLITYCDANYDADMDYCKSQSQYVLILNGGPIVWGSHKQTCTTTSTMEAKYTIVHLASQEIIWMHHLLHDIIYTQTSPTMLYKDNYVAIWLIRNLEFHQYTKHVDVKYHKIQEAKFIGKLLITYINTTNQIVDVLTQTLPRDKFGYMKTLLGLTKTILRTPTSSQMGNVRIYYSNNMRLDVSCWG